MKRAVKLIYTAPNEAAARVALDKLAEATLATHSSWFIGQVPPIAGGHRVGPFPRPNACSSRTCSSRPARSTVAPQSGRAAPVTRGAAAAASRTPTDIDGRMAENFQARYAGSILVTRSRLCGARPGAAASSLPILHVRRQAARCNLNICATVTARMIVPMDSTTSVVGTQWSAKARRLRSAIERPSGVRPEMPRAVRPAALR